MAYESVLKTHNPELVEAVFLEIKKEPELCIAMTAELFKQICENIECYSSSAILNKSAYIKKCLENLLAGKEISETLKNDRNRGRPSEGKKLNNTFNQFQQNDYDFASLEKELLANK